MDLWMIMRVLRRRWYIAVAGLLATVMGAYFVLGVLPSKYQVKQSVVLLAQGAPATATNASADSSPGSPNPYRGFDSSISVTADVMSTAVTQPSVVKRLVAQGASSNYGATIDQQSGGPVVQITASSDKPAVAQRTVQLVTAELRTELANRQRAAGAPPSSWITIADITSPGAPQQMIKGKVRILIALGVLGVGGTVAAAYVFDALCRAWARRKARKAGLHSSSDDLSMDDLEALIAAGVGPREVEQKAG